MSRCLLYHFRKFFSCCYIKSIGKRFLHFFPVFFFHFPQRNRTHEPFIAALLCVGNVKIVFQFHPAPTFVYDCNPFGVPLYPPPKLFIPSVHRKDCLCVRSLCMDKHLFVKRKPVIPACRFQKCHPVLRLFRHIPHRFCIKLCDNI